MAPPSGPRCPPDGGTLCPGYTADGDAVPVECPPPGTGGSFSGNAANSGSDAGGTAVPGETLSPPPPQGAATERGAGCAVCRGVRSGGNDAYAALATLALAIESGASGTGGVRAENGGRPAGQALASRWTRDEFLGGLARGR